MERIARRVIFEGRVQGVGFRFTALDRANVHNVDGHVRNMPDGSVEMLAQGRAEDIDNCIEDINSIFGSSITDIKIEEVPINASLEGFRITF
jgi:acylphosphatase